jgi:protoporphyrinogen/coproporphyrinogen III oxidase
VSSAVVVGGGVTGLMAARRLAQQGLAVTVVEAGHRLGGQVHTAAFEGLAVDVGAEALMVASPATEALLAELRLADTSVSPRQGATWLATPRGLRRLPDGVGPTGPTRLRPVVSSGILSARGVGRAALEPLMAGGRRAAGDVAVGDFVAHRFGREVAERFVDPLLGGIHSGDIHRLSLQACAPQLAPLHASGRSVALAAARRRSASRAGPRFVTWHRGLSSLVLALMDGVDLDLRLGERVTGLTRSGHGHGYAVRLASGASLAADAVVLAVPSSVAARLLQEVAPGVGAVVDGTRFATVATVLAAFPVEATAARPALRGTGLMVPSTAGRLLKAATFLSSKWPHLAGPEVFLVRLSAGRAGSTAVEDRSDEELTASLLADLTDLTGVGETPVATAVHRWSQALAQHEVGHPERVRAARRALAGVPGVVLAGASYEGGGVAGCLRSGETAAGAVLETMTKEVDPVP